MASQPSWFRVLLVAALIAVGFYWVTTHVTWP